MTNKPVVKLSKTKIENADGAQNAQPIPYPPRYQVRRWLRFRAWAAERGFRDRHHHTTVRCACKRRPLACAPGSVCVLTYGDGHQPEVNGLSESVREAAGDRKESPPARHHAMRARTPQSIEMPVYAVGGAAARQDGDDVVFLSF